MRVQSQKAVINTTKPHTQSREKELLGDVGACRARLSAVLQVFIMHHQILRVNLLKLLLGAELVGVATALLAAVVCARVKAGVAPRGEGEIERSATAGTLGFLKHATSVHKEQEATPRAASYVRTLTCGR